MSDPFATAAIRDRVLAGWTAAPARFREDANSEEDFALGGYRDRVVVELAQNAADAARRGGAPGRIRFTLSGVRDDEAQRAVLVAANTGAPLDQDGVGSLATLRASAKRDETATVGRFGVGFAAVLGVTDEPMVLSRTGGVRFSRDDSAAVVDEAARSAPGLAEEVRRRGGHVPALRLPFPADGEPPTGFDTAVVLPLRDESARDLVRRLLAEVDDALLLALPGLERVEIDLEGSERVLADVEHRWRIHRRGGTWDRSEVGQLLADRPTEERDRPVWSVVWALPEGVPPPGVLYAPTPTDEPLSLPALLLASFPLDPTRRHVAAGPLTDRLVGTAATAYAEFVRELAEAGADVAPLVPVGPAVGGLDAALRDAIVAALPAVPALRSVEDGTLLRPRDAVVLDGAVGADPDLLRVLAFVVGGLVAAPRHARAAFDTLGVRRIALADLVDELATVAETHPPTWWRDLYAALTPAAADPADRDALGGLPVPLADGRIVRGVRGLSLPGAEGLPATALSTLAPYGLRVVHPDAAHHLLERLGAIPATPRSLLDEGAVRSAVLDSPDAEDPAAVADAVLGLVAAAGDLAPGELAYLGELALPDDAGELAPASALVLPGSAAAEILDAEDFATVDPEVVERWGADVLEAAGVARTLGVVHAADVDLDALPDELGDLDELDLWARSIGTESVPGGGTAGEVWAIRDLDCVRDWPRALQLLAGEPALRRALVEPARVLRPDGRTVAASSYSGWWIRRHVQIDGVPLGTCRDPEGAAELGAVLDPPPAWVADLDPGVRSALGLPRRLGDLDAAGLDVVLARLADATRAIDAVTMLALWRQLADVEDAVADEVDVPARVRVLEGTTTRVVDSADAVVVDAPMWLQRTDLGATVVVPPALADAAAALFDLPLASEQATGQVAGGTRTPTPEAARLVVPDVPAYWWKHDQLRVDGQEVAWWVDASGRPHAATATGSGSADGLARALAWAAGRWADRNVLAAVLADPHRASDLLAELPYDE